MLCWFIYIYKTEQLNSVLRTKLSDSFEDIQKLDSEFPSNLTSLKLLWEPTIYLKRNEIF